MWAGAERLRMPLLERVTEELGEEERTDRVHEQ